MYTKNTFRVNNFDLIRLVAATQVAIHHTLSHLNVRHGDSVVLTLLSYFPGVPVFFFVSGFLISKSYESNSLIKEYTQNRILRIYPALIGCTFIALLSVYLTGYFASQDFGIAEFVIWVMGQLSFIQFYNPELMRGFGTGVLNGSLWTISVELQFYVMVPILYWIFGLAKTKKKNYHLLALIAVFMVFHAMKYRLGNAYEGHFIFKLLGATFIPWIWMFLVGVLFQKNFAALHKVLSGKILYLLPLYLFVSYFAVEHLGWIMGNGINPILYLLLACVVFSFAYSFPTVSRKILRGNDISYGMYIYHIPVVNILIYYGYTAHVSYAVVAIMMTIILAVISWFAVEKISMKLKKRPLNPLSPANKTINSGSS